MDQRFASEIEKKLAADRRSNRKFYLILAGCVGLVLAVLTSLIVYAAKTGQAERRRFTTQCMEDHKEYECTAMWRAGNSAPPTIIYVPTAR